MYINPYYGKTQEPTLNQNCLGFLLKNLFFLYIFTWNMYLPRLLKNLIYLSVFVYFLYSVYATSAAIYSSSKKTEEIIHKKEVLGAKKEELESKLQVINTDDFVEKEARTKLNMKKEGEELYLIPKPDSEKIDGVTYQETFNYEYHEKDNRSNIQKWMQILF